MSLFPRKKATSVVAGSALMIGSLGVAPMAQSNVADVRHKKARSRIQVCASSSGGDALMASLALLRIPPAGVGAHASPCTGKPQVVGATSATPWGFSVGFLTSVVRRPETHSAMPLEVVFAPAHIDTSRSAIQFLDLVLKLREIVQVRTATGNDRSIRGNRDEPLLKKRITTDQHARSAMWLKSFLSAVVASDRFLICAALNMVAGLISPQKAHSASARPCKRNARSLRCSLRIICSARPSVIAVVGGIVALAEGPVPAVLDPCGVSRLNCSIASSVSSSGTNIVPG